jgi:hypothetical protein
MKAKCISGPSHTWGIPPGSDFLADLSIQPASFIMHHHVFCTYTVCSAEHKERSTSSVTDYKEIKTEEYMHMLRINRIPKAVFLYIFLDVTMEGQSQPEPLYQHVTRVIRYKKIRG